MPKRNQPTKLCYVIMPFSKTKTCSEDEWTDIFESIIKPAVEGAALGYQCLRSEATTGNIIRKVVNSLYQANVVIADLTDRNPNVFYELGVRHTLKNRTIMIAQRRKDIPSDLHGYASHVYRWKTTAQKGELAKKLRCLLEYIETDLDRSDNPVSDFLGERTAAFLDFQKAENTKKLDALVAELYYMRNTLQPNREKAEGAMRPVAVPTPATDLLLATRYIFNSEFFHQLHRFRTVVAMSNAMGGRAQPETADMLGQLCEVIQQNLDVIIADYSADNDVRSSSIKPFPEL